MMFEIIGDTLRKYTGSDKVVEIPKGIKRIGSYAFSGCESVEKVIVPESVETIRDGAFIRSRNRLSDVKMLWKQAGSEVGAPRLGRIRWKFYGVMHGGM